MLKPMEWLASLPLVWMSLEEVSALGIGAYVVPFRVIDRRHDPKLSVVISVKVWEARRRLNYETCVDVEGG